MRLQLIKKSSGLIFGFLLLALLSACTLPSLDAQQNPPTLAAPGPTLSAPPSPAPSLAPSKAPTTAPTPAPSATQPAPSVTPKPAATLAPTAAPAGLHAFAVYDRVKAEIHTIEISSGAELAKYSVPGVGWFGVGRGQVVGGAVYYLSDTDQKVHRVSQSGTTKLEFLPKDLSLNFLVSPDGKQIAWSFDPWAAGAQAPSSQLWIASIDGSKAQKIASIEAADNARFLTVKPYRWLPDGRLVFNYMPTGIGGYILFGGFAGLAVYDPASAKTTTLLAPTAPGSGGLCVHQVSANLKVVVISCGTKDRAQLSLKNVADGKLTEIPVVAEQGTAGSALFSPGNAWLAYAVARSEPDNELGKALLVPAAGGAPTVLAAFSTGYVNISAWVDEDHLLIEHLDSDTPSVWLINRDGTGLAKLADGYFAGGLP